MSSSPLNTDPQWVRSKDPHSSSQPSVNVVAQPQMVPAPDQDTTGSSRESWTLKCIPSLRKSRRPVQRGLETPWCPAEGWGGATAHLPLGTAV